MARPKTRPETTHHPGQERATASGTMQPTPSAWAVRRRSGMGATLSDVGGA